MYKQKYYLCNRDFIINELLYILNYYCFFIFDDYYDKELLNIAKLQFCSEIYEKGLIRRNSNTIDVNNTMSNILFYYNNNNINEIYQNYVNEYIYLEKWNKLIDNILEEEVEK